MRLAMVVLAGAAAAAAGAEPAPAQTPAETDTGPRYQWAVPVQRPSGKTVTCRVWIPPAADRIRGILIGSQAALTDDPSVRGACAAERLAILSVGINAVFNYKEGDDAETFLKVLEEVSKATGYEEIRVAPYFTFGHSVACNYATAAACWQPQRCFGALVFKGGLVVPSYDPAADISGIPILAIAGQFEEFGPGPSGVLRDYEDRETGWTTSRRHYLALRADNERALLSLCVEAGTTHMAWSPRDGQYVALFIRKAAQARIPDWPVDAKAPVKCREIDAKSGALTTTAITNPQAPKAAPYADWKDSFPSRRAYTWWHADLELAQAWEAFHAGRFCKRSQYVTFADPTTGKTLYSRHDLRFSATYAWVGPDVFKVAGAFLLEARDRYPVPEPPVGHADGPIRFRLFGGSGVEQVGPERFRVVGGGPRGASAAIVAYHPGDETYRYAEQPASVRIAALAKGKPQTIAFPPIEGLRPGAEVPLAASADSGLAVTYAVGDGPAVIRDGRLVICGIPPRAKEPFTVKVTAYQWGSAVEPFVQTAEPVTQTATVGR
jgi:hypothetical protein